MTEENKSLDDLVRDELGDEPSQEAKDYAHELYERYRLPEPTEGGGTQASSEARTGE